MVIIHPLKNGATCAVFNLRMVYQTRQAPLVPLVPILYWSVDCEGPMTKKPRENRVPIMMSEEELTAIDDWRFANKIATRSDAIRRLCKIALVIENEFEQVVDVASDGVNILSEQATDIAALHREIVNPTTDDVLFNADEVGDIFRFAADHADVAERGMIGLQQMIVTIFNAIAAIVDARTLPEAVRNLEKSIAEANEAVERAEERSAQREENRYLGIWTVNESDTKREAYQKLSEEEKDEYLSARIAELAAEEEADPRSFADRYLHKPFWETEGWASKLRNAVEQKREAKK